MSLVREVGVSRAELRGAAYARAEAGRRFLTITCVDTGEDFDLIYHFAAGLELEHLRLSLARGETLPSISGVYPAAALVENELQDLYGLKVEGLALDYEGRFLLAEDAPRAPQARTQTAETPAPAGKEDADE